MKVKIHYVVTFVLAAFVFVGCDDDESTPSSKYEQGVFVVNEGAFGKGNGSISYRSPGGEVEQNIFRNAGGLFAGDVIQSVEISGDQAFIVANGDNKIDVVDANTFTSSFTIAGADLDKPRYVEVIDGKAYISTWGAYDENFSLVDSYVLVFDLTTKAFIKKIDTDEGTESLVYNGQHLYASNYNYGSSSTISVIKPSDNSFVKDIEVAAGPAGMVLDANGKLWVVCVGGWGAESTQLFRINTTTNEVEDEITISGVAGSDIAISPDKQKIYYSKGSFIYAIAIAAEEEASEPLFEAEDVVSLSTLNVEAATGNIWIGDAPSFTGIGKVYIYTSEGASVASFDAGIGPTQIVFK